ncbi:MAG: beta-propeller domain-containing protein [Eubacterium sp.]|nr:beta-propeller domain-containing protein [Eubacterium sp.]
MKNDFNFIKEKFDSDNITAPESLSENAVMEKLNNAEEKPVIKVKSNNNRSFIKGFVACAACFAVVAVSLSAVHFSKQPKVISPSPASTEGIVAYASYDELIETVKKAEKKNRTYYGGFLSKSKAADGEIAMESAADSANTVGATESAPESFASTNKQVEAVDEADIVKTDGKYIYYVNDSERNRILIYSAKDGKTELVSKIVPDDYETYFSEIFISGDKLIAVGTRTVYEKEGKSKREGDVIYYDGVERGAYAFVYTYDISNREKPELVDTYEQSGSYSSSRMIGSCVYLISNYGRWYYYGLKNSEFIPCATGEDGKTDKLPIEDICGIDGTQATSYSVIGAVDTKSGKAAKKTKALLGVNNQIYCNEKNLYLTGTYYKNDTEYTRIVKYSVNGTNIELKATGKAKGSVNDQFSMDEKDGNLRIALTDYRWGDEKDRNYLYVLNKNLEIIGQTEGFARNEHIEAVRFIGDTAYVITFERTDPLFIIDLKNPKEPKITGEVKIDGFSSQLLPVDENTMLGIGFCTSEEEFGIVRDGVKLALFDISDKNEPKVLDEFEMKNSDSEAQYNHKAITINPDSGYWAIPIESYYSYEDEDFADEYENGALEIRIKDGKLEVKNHKIDADEYATRCTYIGSYLYVLTGESKNVYSFEIQ